TRKWYKGEDESVHNALLVGSQDIVSARPLAILAETDQLIRRNPGALEFFNRNSPEEVWLSLKKFPEIREKVDMYLTTFGDRTVGELKFETETYRQYPQRLIKVIQANLKQRTPLKKEQEEARVSVRKEAEKKVMAGIGNPFRKMIFRYLLKRTRYLVSNRENLRFERTRAFGMLRRMFLVLGGKLAKADALSAPRDIFYLRESEIFEWLEGTSVTINLKELVELRKQEYLQFGKEESPGERVETYGIVYQELDNETVVEDEESDLKGTACCAGVVEANIRVIHDPHEVKEGLNGEILVTSSTDPGWITLFYGAAGVLVERGSLLSHSAIVSREMGLPCIVSVKGLLKRLKTGDRVRMNGSTGTIEILDKNERENAA
ncbi:MAG: PEP-utilizing enzyme, partial [Owenweeksia sp.]